MRIFLDLHDVCCQFRAPVFELRDWAMSSFSMPDLAVNYGRSWLKLSREFYANLPATPEFEYLYGRCLDAVGIEDICILSACTNPGAVDWIESHFPSAQQYLLGEAKHFCARPDSLLIDDSDFNITRFRNHGGDALTIPRPWNCLAGIDVVSHIDMFFSLL